MRHLTLNRPARRNALTPALARRVAEEIERLAVEDECRAVVLRGAGGHFSSGLDLHWLQSLGAQPTISQLQHGLSDFQSAVLAVVRCPVPVVAVVEGTAAGFGLDLALACDIRVCGEGASAKARSIGSRRLLALVGHVVSVDLLRQRGTLDAQTLLDTGLVSDLVPAGAVLEAASGIAGTVASRGPIATRLAKEAIWRGLELPLPQGLRFETDLTLLLQTTKDRAEGVEAFLDKRPPEFTGE